MDVKSLQSLLYIVSSSASLTDEQGSAIDALAGGLTRFEAMTVEAFVELLNAIEPHVTRAAGPQRAPKQPKSTTSRAAQNSVADLTAELNTFLRDAKHGGSTQADVTQRMQPVQKLTKPQLLALVKELNSDAGLAKLTKTKILDSLRDMMNRVVGTAERVKQ